MPVLLLIWAWKQFTFQLWYSAQRYGNYRVLKGGGAVTTDYKSDSVV